jgi:ribosome biogenesis GTPase
VPGADAATRAVRRRDRRGRHTTSAAVFYELPRGGVIIDTPGIRELGMGMRPAELSWYFPEFEPLLGGCRFGNCTHAHEPGCAVRAAVEAGRIAPRRYNSYLRILETLDNR